MERRAGVDAPHGDERSVERLMDAHLKAHGLCRKRIAKDGSCLFRAVAEQVLHCQSLHTRVRAECVKYLREKRDLYESFIEGDFEEYLRMLQDPQSWVGQVEISALAVLYKHDFIIYQNPGEAPVNITQNGYPDKVLLCFLNGNHYDSVYPVPSVEKAAVCQSILYELLYERVFHVDRNALTASMRMSKGTSETIITEERESSGNSDLDEGEDFWSGEATSRPAGVNNRTAYKGRGRGQARGVGRGCLLRKVQESLSPSHFRNVEYEVWLRSKRVQQRRDFCIAAGMHYKAGDKCQVRLNNTDRFYSAYIQDVSADDGPVTVFIEELGEKYSVPLWNLRSHSEESWSTVTEKTKRQTSSSTNGHTERDTRHGRKPMRSMSHGSPQSTVESQSLGKNGSSRRSDPGTGGYGASPLEEDDHALLELLNKDEENFPSLEASAQAASIEGSRRPEKKGTRKKGTTDTKEQSLNPSHKPERGKQTKKSSVDQDQGISPPQKELTPTQSSTLPAPSDTKLTTAAPVSKTPHARVPYKSSISARIPPMQSQTAPAPSSRPPVSSQTTHIQSPNASAPSTKPLDSSQITPVQSPAASAPSTKPVDSIKTTPIQSPAASAPLTKLPDSIKSTPIQSPAASAPSTKPVDSIKTTPIQSPAASAASTKLPDSIHTTLIQSPLASAPSTKPLDSIKTTPIQSPPASAPSSGPPDSSQTTAMQSPTAPAPPKRPIVLFEDSPVKSQAALKPSGVISVSSQTNLAQPQSLPMPTTSLNTPISFQSTPTQCITMPKTNSVTTTSVPQNLSQTIQSHVLDRPAAVTTPVILSSVPDAITTPAPFQPTTIPVSTYATAPNPVSTPVSSSSSTQSASSPTHTISQTTSVTSPAPTQIPFVTEVPGSTELSAASKTPPEQTSSEQQDSADAPSHIHVSHSITPPAQPAPSLGPPYHIGFGTHLPYPPYPPYPAPMPSFSPNTSAPMPDPCHPPTVPTPPFAHAPQTYLCDPAISPVAGAGGALLPDAPSQHPFSVQQICQDMCYPGFPQNEKGEPVPPPPFSHNTTGNDLPNDTSVLRFFFNLGLKAFMYQMLAPVTYLAPLVQAYQHMQFKVSPAPVSWQPDNSRPIFPSPNPSPAGSTFSHFDVRNMVRTPSPLDVGLFSHHSVPMQMPLPGAPHPNVYTGMHPVPPAGSSQQYSAPPHSVGSQHFSVPHPRHYGTELPMPTVLPIIEGGQRALMPHVEKQFCPGQGQQHSEGGDIKPGTVPLTMEMQHSSGAQGGVPSKGAELAALANGNRQEKGSDFVEEWQTEKAEFSEADLKTGRSYYKSGFRRGQDERGGYRGRGQRGKREYTGYGRQDGQFPYYRGSGGRSRGRGYNNNKATGYSSRQFTPAPES